MLVAHDYPRLIRELHTEFDGQDERWRSQAHEIVQGRLQSPHAFLEWATRDHHWSFTLAEVMRDVRAKPSELATRLLIAILEELREEQQTAFAVSE